MPAFFPVLSTGACMAVQLQNWSSCSSFWHWHDGPHHHFGWHGLLLLPGGSTTESHPERKATGCGAI